MSTGQPATTPSDTPTPDRRRRITAGLPMHGALFAVTVVWVLGCVWSYQEQSAFAADKGFAFPHLLPLVIDGFAVAMAGVAWAASLDARPAVPARLATLVAVAGSAASNGVWAWLRTNHDVSTVVLAVAVPVAANLAFEVLLAELRRQVQRRRGLPAPVALPALRLIRVALAPASTFRAWRLLVLDLTEPIAALPTPRGAGGLDPYVSTPDDGSGSPLGRDTDLGWPEAGCPVPGVPPVPDPTANGHRREAGAVEDGQLALPCGLDVGRDPALGRQANQTDRARTVAASHAARTGELPTVRELAGMAEVGRGTADRALTTLRAGANGPHVVGNPSAQGAQQ